MIKTLKIMSVYLGHRRIRNNNPKSPEEALQFLKKQIENEINIDPGCNSLLLRE